VGFQLLDFDHPDDLPVLHAEVFGVALRKEGTETDVARTIFDTLQAAALSCEDSRGFITQLA
jgi:hypothetical protein